MAPGCLLICRHGLWGVDPWKSMAKGHHGIFALRSAGRDHCHICTRALQGVIWPLMLKTSVEEAFRVGGGKSRLSINARFHLQVVKYGLLAYVGQGAGGAM